jgi:hypothetical protein
MSLARLDAIAKALKSLPQVLERTVGEVVADNAYVLELDNLQQLEAGLDAEGQRIEPPYTGTTREIKKQKGQPTDRVTLKDKGDFYRGIVAKVRAQDVGLEGTDSKTQELQEKYGQNIIGLSDEAVDAFREDYVRPELQYKTREVLGL